MNMYRKELEEIHKWFNKGYVCLADFLMLFCIF